MLLKARGRRQGRARLSEVLETITFGNYAPLAPTLYSPKTKIRQLVFGLDQYSTPRNVKCGTDKLGLLLLEHDISFNHLASLKHRSTAMSEFVPGIEEAEMQAALANDIIAGLAATVPPPQRQPRGTCPVRPRGTGRGGRRGRQPARSGRLARNRAQPGGLAVGAGPAIRPPEQDQHFDLQPEESEAAPGSRFIPHHERMRRKEEAIAANRPGLFMGYLASQGVPLPQQLCQHCTTATAAVACRTCSEFRKLLSCGSCDQAKHPHAHTHTRHTWADGYWQPMQGHESIDDSTQSRVTGGSFVQHICLQ